MKVALVYSFTKSSWFSCRVITKNIRETYFQLYGKENITEISYSHKGHVEDSDINKIIDNKIEKIIFIDHKPTPYFFLRKLSKLDKETIGKIEYCIHVFGDFPLYLLEWERAFDILKGKKTRFICASERQMLFVQNFLKQNEIVKFNPFPVDINRFQYNEESNSEIRNKLDINNSTNVLLYTGRFSYLKRTTDLIEIFLELQSTSKIENDSKLVLAGKFDEIGFPYRMQFHALGEYFRSVERVLAKYPEFRDNIIFTGEIDNEELPKYYNMADAFISLSTYHDEDYGMSIAEAGCCGLPLILTDWAGYYSFQLKENKEYCDLIPVKLAADKPKFCADEVKTKIIEVLSRGIDRKLMAQKYQEEFSIAKSVENIRRIEQQNINAFEGGSSFFYRLVSKSKGTRNSIFVDAGSKELNKEYYEAYNVYTR